MEKKYLTYFDVMGIQNFIFSTNKLKENIGSSNIVENVLKKHLKNILIENYKVIQDLKQEERFLEEQYDALIVYIAGGNAFIIFSSLKTAKDVSFELSKQVLIETGGLLNLAVAYEETDFQDFKKDYENLVLKIDKNKFEFTRTNPLLGIGITKQEQSSGLPAQILITREEEKEPEIREYLSYPSYRKRYIADKAYFEDEYLAEDKKIYRFPRKIEELGQKRGENYIAVVHIDGNEIGNTKHELLSNIADPYKALFILHDFSKKLQSLFQNCVKYMIKDLIKAIENRDLEDFIKTSITRNKVNLPIRPLILNGDDITFICNGKIGISLAKRFLEILEKEKERMIVNGKAIPISASGGIAIVKSRFPFFRAYGLSEELCRSAKIKGKIIENTNLKYSKKGHWIDFQVTQAGMSDELKDIREQKYNIPGIKTPLSLELSSNGIVELEYIQYNLLKRPWCIAGECKEKYSWSQVEKILKRFEEDRWPLNKLARFKKSLLTSKERTDQYLIEIGTEKKFQLNNIWIDNITPYFDALEIRDYYIPFVKR